VSGRPPPCRSPYRCVVDSVTLERRARRIVAAGPGLEQTCLDFDALLREVVPYAAAAWSTHDPMTGLFTSCTVTGIEKDLQREAELFRYEFRDDEPATFSRLIAEGRTVAVLSEVTGGDLERAARYRELGRPLGVTDEIRAVLWSEQRPYGSVILYAADGWFTAEHAATVAAAAPYAADGLRLALLRGAATRPRAVPDPPGILRVGADGQVGALTEPAHRWLELGGAELVTAANVVAAAVCGHRDWAGATSRLVIPGARVLSLHGSQMLGEDVAVILDAARPGEVAALMVEAYGLTRRQRDVLGLLLLGRSMTRIARELGISEHTANDHRKAIYTRTGVSSRSELAALLQSEFYSPRTHAGVPPSPYGGFLEA
jgi:DNA-binding CsgD family transcriptional regulator